MSDYDEWHPDMRPAVLALKNEVARARTVTANLVIELARAQHTRDAIEACAVTILAKLEPANAVLMQRAAKP